MKLLWSYLRFAFFFTFLTLAGVTGWTLQNHSSLGTALLVVSALTLLEIAISFDNAVVNVTVLRDMEPAWQHRFLTWGIWIAVFGMRFLFPILIVSWVTQLGPWEAGILALQNPEEYARIMHSVRSEVNAFGGSFLALVALKYFIDHEKDEHWLAPLERPLSLVGRVESTQVGVVLLILFFVTRGFEAGEGFRILLAGVGGVLTWLFVEALNAVLDQGLIASVTRTGVGGFIYLEILDASFSFDGVIGALALTNQLVLIAAGLGVGAFYVRSLTMFFLEQGTLQKLKYLEHGAFWAVGMLAGVMFLGIHVHISEIWIGLLSLAILVSSVWSSLRSVT
ncbi:MAG: DUF475 domain-containing protein [Bdellovibrio sp.]